MIFIGNHQNRNVVKKAEFCSKLWGFMGGIFLVIGPAILIWGVYGANMSLAPVISGAIIGGFGIVSLCIMAFYLCIALKTDEDEYKRGGGGGGANNDNKIHPRGRHGGHNHDHSHNAHEGAAPSKKKHHKHHHSRDQAGTKA